MSNIERKTKAVISAWMKFLAPDSMSSKERQELANKAGLSPETLRTALKRNSINGETLVRLFLARGVSVDALLSYRELPKGKMTEADLLWSELGLDLTEVEKIQIVEVVRFIKARKK